ncbi:ADP-ribosylglycohydrolase family protein [Streptomyces echinatus]|uniref:ADP-ribosylglycohydrolase family protein n=1 Tax=Streptomyces echinatus TaxID=67293 RepID=UPI003823B539
MASIARTPPVPAPEDAAGPRERARGALLGLAVGDALGAPAENLRPSEIRARWGRITGYVTDQPCGTDDTEYAIFSGLLLARHGSALTPAHVEAAWHEWIADRAEGPFRGAGFSERGTLENLRRGLAAPISAQHRHAWSDGLAMRAAPFGVFAAGRPAEAARLVAVDGSVSHDGEGIYGGQAVAAGVAAAMTGAPVPVVIAAALAVVPDDSWTARSLRRAVAVAHHGERAVRSAVVIGGYPWTDLAPEAVALAFGAYAAADGDFREAVLTAVNMGRDADTTAAVAGALSGATQGLAAIPTAWATAIGPVRGRCLPSMAGHHVLEVADLLVSREAGEPADAGPTSGVRVIVEARVIGEGPVIGERRVVEEAATVAEAVVLRAAGSVERVRAVPVAPAAEMATTASASTVVQAESHPMAETATEAEVVPMPGTATEAELIATPGAAVEAEPILVAGSVGEALALEADVVVLAGMLPDPARNAPPAAALQPAAPLPPPPAAAPPAERTPPSGTRATGPVPFPPALSPPPEPPEPASPPAPAGRTPEPDGGWAGGPAERTDRSRSPLVGAGNAGQADSEGPS